MLLRESNKVASIGVRDGKVCVIDKAHPGSETLVDEMKLKIATDRIYILSIREGRLYVSPTRSTLRGAPKALTDFKDWLHSLACEIEWL